MEGLLKEKTRIVSQAGIDYVVNKLIGSGGQGEVYEVEANGKKYALKWYFKNMATDTQEQILKNLVSQGAPDETFLWPLDFVPRNERGSFGYIMNLRPKEYKGINDLLTRRAEPTFYTLCKVCLNLTKGYQRLHSKGYSYRDISNGNVFFNPNDGNVLICDNDNVSVNGKDDSSVYGTPKYMAPELVLHKDKPSTKTDLFSLSVLIFYMLMIAHPLDGKREASIKCFDPFAMEELYGKNPLFIFDPDDRSNAPLPGYHDNALVFWELYPEFLRHLFTRSFTEGLKSPGKRLVEKEWMDASIKLMNSIVYCECGAEVFYDESLEDAGKAHICWCCGKKLICRLV